MLQSLHLSHLPLSYTVFVAVYRDLRNAAYLKEQLLVGNSAFEYAFIDASLVRLGSSWTNTAVSHIVLDLVNYTCTSCGFPSDQRLLE